MQLRVNFKSGKAVYLQVMDQVKSAAASGALRPGEALPSIGALAEELRVNRNSVAKAYSELERLGVIESQPTGGYCLKKRDERLAKEVGRKPLTAEIDPAIMRAPLVFQSALVYSLLTTLLGALYLGLVLRGKVAAVLAAAVVAAVFLPARSLIHRFVHRLVFARRFEFPRLLRIIKLEAPSQPDLGSLIERVIERTETALGARLEFIHDRAAVMSQVHSFPALRSARAPVSAGADFLMPVFSGEEVLGLLRLAPKSTGEEYDAEDLEFLAAVSEQAAIAANQIRIRSERQESEYALDIQRGLLPREVPQFPGFTIAGAWQPAKVVGGDYYDVFKLSETELALVVADVSGKGMPAALLMSNLQATAKAYATSEASPKRLCDKVNRAICNSISGGRFITFFYAALDLESHRLTYTNAGHNPPLIARQDGSCLKLDTGGIVLGLFADASYEQNRIELLHGDRLVMFTDGITEASNSSGEEFGEERLIALLHEHPAGSAADLRDAIMQEVTQFCRGDFADDATLLTVMASSVQISEGGKTRQGIGSESAGFSSGRPLAGPGGAAMIRHHGQQRASLRVFAMHRAEGQGRERADKIVNAALLTKNLSRIVTVAISPRPIGDPSQHRAIQSQRAALQRFMRQRELREAIRSGEENQAAVAKQCFRAQAVAAQPQRNILKASGAGHHHNLLPDLGSCRDKFQNLGQVFLLSNHQPASRDRRWMA